MADEVATLRMQVDRLISRCTAKDEEFAKERRLLTAKVERLERELKAAQKEARCAA